MRRLIVLGLSVFYTLVMVTAVLAQETGWRNLTWGMNEKQTKTAMKCENGYITGYNESSNFARRVLLQHSIKAVGLEPVLNTIDFFNCPANEAEWGTFPVFFKGRFIGVSKHLDMVGFADDASAQKTIMDQLKSAYPSGTITTVKQGGHKYPVFSYKSSTVEVFNDYFMLIMISSQGAQSIVDAFNNVNNEQKSLKEKQMKVF